MIIPVKQLISICNKSIAESSAIPCCRVRDSFKSVALVLREVGETEEDDKTCDMFTVHIVVGYQRHTLHIQLN